jgi:hypothetical protein
VAQQILEIGCFGQLLQATPIFLATSPSQARPQRSQI